MAVAGEGIQRHVAEHADVGEFLLDRAHRLADQIVRVERLGTGLVAQGRLGIGEQRDAGDLELHRPFGVAHRLIDGEPVDAGHRGDGRARVVAVDHEQRPDQVVGGQHVFPHQPPRPFRLAVAPRADREVQRGGGEGALPPRRVAHFDRTPEFDRHVMGAPEGGGSVLICSSSSTLQPPRHRALIHLIGN